MISEEDRNKKPIPTDYTVKRFYERGILDGLFSHCNNAVNIWHEFCDAYYNKQKSVIIPDKRHGRMINSMKIQSTHIMCFINSSGGYVAVPIKIQDGEIHALTMKNIRKDSSNPNWFVRKYNEVADKRVMQRMNIIVKQ